MSQKKPSKSEMIGALFSRTTTDTEIHPEGWGLQINDIMAIAKSANTLLCIYSDDGSGKTTFIRQFSKKASHIMDVITINPTSSALAPGWISHALAEWSSSDSGTSKMLQQKLSALKDSDRPIIIAIDSGDLIDPQQMNGDISAVLNLGDAAELKLSILLVCSGRKAEELARDPILGNRLVFKKILHKLGPEELVQITRAKLRHLDMSASTLSDLVLLDMAKKSNGSPTRMAHLICDHLGYEVPTSPREKNDSKTPSLRKSKKNHDSNMISIDDLLAPKPKD